MFITSILLTCLLSLTSVLAAPANLAATTTTTTNLASNTVPLTGVTHTVVAGLAGLHYDPENVVANVGDIIEWHYLAKNHSVVQSSFGAPCVPLAGGGFFSGFLPVGDGQVQNPNVFQVTITDTNPIWYYCAQTVGSHCQSGMAGVINQNFNSQNTLANYKNAAALTSVSIAPPTIGGGNVIPNPNPLGGF